MNNSIWFDEPAPEWEEGMPIGNGYLGGMIIGGVKDEKIFLNEESIWDGTSKDRVNPDAREYIPRIRELLFKGEVEKAQSLSRMALTSNPQYVNPYVPGGYAWFFFEGHKANYSNYKRVLNMDTGCVKVQYTCEGIDYEREYLASNPDGVIAIHLTCNKERGLNFSVNLNRRPYDGTTSALDQQMVMMSGNGGVDGIAFTTVLGAVCKAGTIETIGNFVNVQEATDVTVYIATETSFKTENHLQQAQDKVKKAMAQGYEKIKKKHIEDYQSLYMRNQFSLNTQGSIYPTDELITRCREGEDANHLMELIYNFGKYLMISSSRKSCLPTTLQGIWNNSYTPAWESNYTININTQMNYWPAEISNLSECHQPLFDFIERLCENGKEIAKTMYGCRGAVAHHISNIWAEAPPLGILDSSPYWPMGLAWLSLHMYEHYKFTGNQLFLQERCYPVIKEVALFYIDYLVESPDGYYVTGPSVSPENSYVSASGEIGALCMGPTMDIQIIREIFEAVQLSEAILEIAEGITPDIEKIQEKLPPTRVGKYGQVMEWYQDFEEVELGHRHISHLFGLHPGSQITKSKTPELFEAAKVTLKKRLDNGGGHTGWSKAWIVNFYARLLEGEKAYENIRGLLNTSVRNSLLDVHPPFQIDGNFGVSAAIGEMIVQSHEEAIRLLPALPLAWESGKMAGICARGGFEIDIAWEENKIKQLSIYSRCGNDLKLYQKDIKDIINQDGQKIKMQQVGEMIRCQTTEGSRYNIYL